MVSLILIEGLGSYKNVYTGKKIVIIDFVSSVLLMPILFLNLNTTWLSPGQASAISMTPLYSQLTCHKYSLGNFRSTPNLPSFFEEVATFNHCQKSLSKII